MRALGGWFAARLVGLADRADLASAANGERFRALGLAGPDRAVQQQADARGAGGEPTGSVIRLTLCPGEKDPSRLLAVHVHTAAFSYWRVALRPTRQLCPCAAANPPITTPALEYTLRPLRRCTPRAL